MSEWKHETKIESWLGPDAPKHGVGFDSDGHFGIIDVTGYSIILSKAGVRQLRTFLRHHDQEFAILDELPKSPVQCDCRLCKRSRLIREAVLSRDTDALISMVEELQEENHQIGDGEQYYESILNGSWPSAEEILVNVLEKIRAKPSEVTAG